METLQKIQNELFIHALKAVINKNLSAVATQNTRIDGRSILVKTPACQICSPF